MVAESRTGAQLLRNPRTKSRIWRFGTRAGSGSAPAGSRLAAELVPHSNHFRALARRPVAIRATLFSHDAGWEQPVAIVDLGLGGARLELGEAIPAQSSVRLMIASPDRWDPIALDARVAWARGPTADRRAELGLEFLPRQPADLGALLDLLGGEGYE
jgi:hypothetical protein